MGSASLGAAMEELGLDPQAVTALKTAIFPAENAAATKATPVDAGGEIQLREVR